MTKQFRETKKITKESEESMIKRHLPIYNESKLSAEKSGRLGIWEENYQSNIQCSQALHKASEGGNVGYNTIDEADLSKIVGDYGLQRVAYVLVTSMMEDSASLSIDNLEWAESYFLPYDFQNTKEFKLPWDMYDLNSFADSYRSYYKEKSNLFTKEHCYKENEHEKLLGQIVALNPEKLANQFRFAEHQMEFVDCLSNDLDNHTAVFETISIEDGAEPTRKPEDILGIIREEFLPDWAKEKQVALQNMLQETEDLER